MFELSPHAELHPVFESLGYMLGFLVYKRSRRCKGDVINSEQRWNVIAASTLGALVGSRLLEVLQQVSQRPLALAQMFLPGGGKTVVGGLLGGWLCVELVKKWQGITTRTGDLFALPLCVGIGVGRIGCFLTGLAEDTYGQPTSLPWGVNFGDGIGRHPTQAYEILFMGLLALALRYKQRYQYKEGTLFRLFLLAYLAWRLLIDFLKPPPFLLPYGMSMIQWACLAGLITLLFTWPLKQRERKQETEQGQYA